MQKLVHHLPWLSGGRAPDARVRARVEQLTGVDLSRVRVHSTSAAGALSDALGARALTMGAHVAFAHDEYRPGTPAGDTLLAHELAHAAQQARGDTASLTGLGGSTARREQLEREAGEVGRHSADGGAAPRWSAAARASRTAASGMPAAPAVQLAPKPDAAASPVSTPLPPAVDDWPNFVDNLAERVNANVFTGYYNITWGKPPDEIEVNVRGDATELYEGPANTMIALNEVHADLAAARKAVADAHELTEHGFVVYTYYRGPGGSIVPTLYSPRSTPNIYAAMMKAITERRAQAGESAEALKGVAIGIAGGIVLRGVLGRVMRWGTGPVKSPTTTTTTLDEPVPSTGKGPSTTSTGNVAPVEVEGVGGAKVEPVKVEPVKVEPVKVPQTTGGEPEGLGVKTGEPVKAAVKEPVKAPVKTPTEEPVVAPYRPCFLAGTEVQAGGRVIPIEEVAVGDAVLG
ncbi:MAG TPA: DUF4157 domain-containing protein, partial [Gemmatimonadaceae bacterium]|nr:DUF4157 domain-containing protein [Gemmatimonadaceae bacterium]